MSSLSDAVAASGFASRVIHDSQLADLLGGSDARRYGLVNRALADRSLIRLRPGADVMRFLRPAEAKSVGLRSERFFQSRLAKLANSITDRIG